MLGAYVPLIGQDLGMLGTATTVPDLRAALNAYLRADTTLAALVGTRIRPGWRPQADGVPAITYRVESLQRVHALAANANHNTATIALDCWALTVADCVRIKQRLEDLLDTYVGAWSGLTIAACLQDDEGDDHLWRDDGTDSPYVRLTVRYHVRHATRQAAS